MRNKILKLLIASMLFVSMEGMADSMDEVTFESSQSAVDSGNQSVSDADVDDGDSCNHYCHAHFVGLLANQTLPNVPQPFLFSPVLRTQVSTYSSAPPTPPPNV